MAVQNSLAAKKPTAQTSLTMYLQGDAVKKQINQVVGGKNGTRFISPIISAYQATPALRECTNSSILNAALLGEALNLSPSPQLGQYYFVPFKNKKAGTTTATFVLGYKGLVQLAIRSGYYRKLNGISQEELAEKIGKSVGYIGMIEAPGVSKGVSIKTLFDISDVLNVPIQKFFEEF